MGILIKYKFHFGFLAIAIIAFWQIAFFIHPVKYDMIDGSLPERYFIAECLKHYKLPLWNPYTNLGYPTHANPSSGAWYPVVWIIGYFGGYSIFSLAIEFILHIFLAGVGFYKLSKTLQLSNDTALFAGICYMLCGVFIGNAQHLNFIISACWIPYILNYYLKMTDEPGYLNCLKTALFLFLLISGGYPAFTIILFYLLLLLFVCHSIRYAFNKKISSLILFFKQNLLFTISTLLLSAVMLVSIYQIAPVITRTGQFTIQNSQFGPFSPQSFISFILPFASIKDPLFFDSDISMTNAYFGIIPFIFFIYGIFTRKSFTLNILFGFAIFCLLAAVGRYLPVRSFLFEYIPMMDLFRFPSIFRLFVIIGFVLAAAFSFEKFMLSEFIKQKKLLIASSVVLVLIFIVIIFFARYSGYLDLLNFIKKDVFIYSKTSSIIQHIAFQSILQVVILLLFVLVLKKVTDKIKAGKFIIILIIVDLIICTQLNAPYTAYYSEYSAEESNEHMKTFPKGFPQLDSKNISETKYDSLYFGPFWTNLSTFQKQISAGNGGAFCFSNFAKLQDSTPQLFAETTKNKIAFLSDAIHEEIEINKFKKDTAFTNKMLFLKSEDFNTLKTMQLKTQAGDTAQLTYFSPDSFIVKTETKQTQLLTLLQNDYRGWQVYINDQKTSHFTSNETLISILVPAGINKVSFVYKNETVKIAFYISVISLIITVLLIIFQTRKIR